MIFLIFFLKRKLVIIIIIKSSDNSQVIQAFSKHKTQNTKHKPFCTSSSWEVLNTAVYLKPRGTPKNFRVELVQLGRS